MELHVQSLDYFIKSDFDEMDIQLAWLKVLANSADLDSDWTGSSLFAILSPFLIYSTISAVSSENLLFANAKTKVLISCTIIMQLISTILIANQSRTNGPINAHLTIVHVQV